MAALEQPKKPTGGAYGQFLAEKRADFAKKCAGQAVTAVSKMAGAEFKKLTEAQKKPYQQKYEAAKEKFDKDMKAFLDAGGEKQKGATALRAEKRKAKEDGGKKAAKDPNAPKKPAGGGYGQFVAEKRPEFMEKCKGKPITEVSKLAGVAWKKLTDAQKAPYQAKYDKAKADYEKAMASYKPQIPEAEDEEEEAEEEEEEAKPKKKARQAKK